MRLIISGILLMLAGCATAPQPKPEWRLVNGAWVGPATTYQEGSEPGHSTCNDPRYTFACQSDSVRRAIQDAAGSIK